MKFNYKEHLVKKSKVDENSTLDFTCIFCGRLENKAFAKCLCGNSMFKVSRQFSLINSPLEPYRNKSDEENGYYLSNAGDVETSMGGAENYDFPQDGGDDDVGTPNANSDDLLQDSGMRNSEKSPYPTFGIHNMNAVMPTSSPNPSVFERVRSKLMYNYNKGV